VVEAVNLRTTVLRDNQGRVHVIPNGSIAVVTNTTKGWGRVVVDVTVAYSEKVDRVIEVLQDIGKDMEADPKWKAQMLDSLEIMGVNNLGGTGVEMRVAIKVRPEDRLRVGRELRRRIKNQFDELGIAYPLTVPATAVGTVTGTPR
jgi:small conductance mechanosensitive channel